MRAIMSGILMIVLSVASATAGICHYCDTIPAILSTCDTLAPENFYYGLNVHVNYFCSSKT